MINIILGLKALIKYMEEFVHLGEAAKSKLKLYTEKQVFGKNKFILSLGQRCDYIWFLKKGMVRKYYLHEGREITTWIHTENQIFTSLNAFAKQSPSDEFIQAVEDTELIAISKDNSKKLSEFPDIMQFTNLMMEQQFINIDVHSKALSQRGAREKYEYLFQIAPEMIKRAKLIHIASILNISPETLSRVRRIH
jgi:CRP-like cAMP-binding protein